MEPKVICFQCRKEKIRKNQGSHFYNFHLVAITSNFALSVYHSGLYFMVRMEDKCIFITTFMFPISCMGIKDTIMLIIP